MDFMAKYAKELASTSRNRRDDEISTIKPNDSSAQISDVDTMLKSREKLYQKMIVEQLEEKKILKVTNIRIPASPQSSDVNSPNMDNSNSSISREEIIRECEDIKDRTTSLQNEADNLVQDIATTRDNTMDAINAIMKELSKKFQLGNLDGE
ncbi:Virion core protein [Deerpox virus W-848-83]|uniref:39kDa core protein OPG130 n=1 Tax=Deerpox virus (strain Mule deer/United States/W-848-83/1983) TaxID=305674 RepID=Q08FP8_DPV83|nr:Virion core protein (morphogenesis) [Deerpox virus W-848-83]ABI99259.1 Virion core protein [Deerpox virus W-848-83]